jgi:tetratricopeptide (TPR) repeat protein
MGTAARIEELRKKFEENPRRYFAPLANEYRKSGDLEQAIAICRDHLADQPTHMSGHIVFGQALFESAQLAEAQEVFTQALALDPENLIALRHLGDIARAQGESGAARAWYQRVLDADPRNDEIAALVRELAASVPVEGFAGMPADTVDQADEGGPAADEESAAATAPASAEVAAPQPALPDLTPEVADAETVEFVPPRLSSLLDLPEFPEPSAGTVRHASALPPENVVEPLPDTIEISTVDAQRIIEQARAAAEPALADFEPTSWTPEAVAPVVPDADLEMPTADEIRHPAPAPEQTADPLADLPMEMLEDYGNASAESLLGLGAPAPESPLAALESELGVVDDPTPLVGGSAVDGALDFMENPLAELASATQVTEDPMSSLDGLSTLEEGNAFAPEPPLPPPAVTSFEPVDTVAPETPRSSAVVPRQPTPAAGVPFVTEAMGEVLEGQGLHAQAADVYRSLLDTRPGDARLSAKLAAVEEKLAPAASTVVDWLRAVAEGRLNGAVVPSAQVVPAVGQAVVPAASATVEPAPASAPASAPAPAPEHAAAPAHSGSAFASLDALFGPPTNADDERAALALSALFDATPAAAIGGAPTAPASDELSLRTVFEPPAAPAPRTSAAFSFDQFFSAAPKSSTPAPGAHDPELAEFTRWLDGLKKQ